MKQDPQLLCRKLYRMKEGAAMLGISTAQAYNLANRGEIPVIKLGSSRRIPADALNDLIARKMAESLGK
jgi:excisionase family DNA binding protein